jgi:DNA-binding CsgD family transcriptional regulator
LRHLITLGKEIELGGATREKRRRDDESSRAAVVIPDAGLGLHPTSRQQQFRTTQGSACAGIPRQSHGVCPFNRARTELAYGEYLRRARRRVDAREHLRAALETFEGLRAAAWAERATQELRASGESVRRRDGADKPSLTPQECQVAQLVRNGMSNKDVAAQLFVSPRTVDFHLRNVFTKTGVSSRGELIGLELG